MFHFSIRELLLITSIIALGSGWIMDHINKRAAHRMLVRELDTAKQYSDGLKLIINEMEREAEADGTKQLHVEMNGEVLTKD